MLLTGQKFSVIMTGTGVIALAGIVVNNAIVLIDTFNRERKVQPDVLTAVLATTAQRIRPILLTTITTIAGLIPMAAQVTLDFFTRTISVGGITSIWWVQLSTAIISGLAFSTILTLIVVPVMLALPETAQRTVAFVRRRPFVPAGPVGAATAAGAALSAPVSEPTPASAPPPVRAVPVSVPMMPAVAQSQEPALVRQSPEPAAAVERDGDAYAPLFAPMRRMSEESSQDHEPAKRQGDIYAPVLMRGRRRREDRPDDESFTPAAAE